MTICICPRVRHGRQNHRSRWRPTEGSRRSNCILFAWSFDSVFDYLLFMWLCKLLSIMIFKQYMFPLCPLWDWRPGWYRDLTSTLLNELIGCKRVIFGFRCCCWAWAQSWSDPFYIYVNKDKKGDNRPEVTRKVLRREVTIDERVKVLFDVAWEPAHFFSFPRDPSTRKWSLRSPDIILLSLYESSCKTILQRSLLSNFDIEYVDVQIHCDILVIC